MEPRNCRLKSGETHIWYLSPSEVEIKTHFLSSDEIERGKAFRFDRHRKTFWAYRILLRKVLSLYTGVPPEELLFNYTPFGKPYIDHEFPLWFNLSHTEPLAALAITGDCPVGIDIEKVGPIEDLEGLVDQFFSPQEFREFKSLNKKEQTDAFYFLWTCKESYVKGIGEGLFHSLDRFSVPLIPYLKSPEQRGAITGTQWFFHSTTLSFKGEKYVISCSFKNPKMLVQTNFFAEKHLLE
ncbi:4'-phosphopantetheinyl transferase superfamily protein [Candidatus Neptunochlamydia vexilliferae]|uniref:4'-phosphopantetheinyl transferase HetI n=1 Tax=Candidatus Neptunichlamydia vexilliferae TaxID=1651774 RepID=A0ABS0AXX9_9BACT|nr:4'-phosphopantetheinyl transferase superfamily protein [Candidatus Neptunochlamydia vexilliferae]MBF5058993.1 4'-phosphopantetheinyl transferase HetI [Candidatus Neptunochlamydia vexilliferae]